MRNSWIGVCLWLGACGGAPVAPLHVSITDRVGANNTLEIVEFQSSEPLDGGFSQSSAAGVGQVVVDGVHDEPGLRAAVVQFQVWASSGAPPAAGQIFALDSKVTGAESTPQVVAEAGTATLKYTEDVSVDGYASRVWVSRAGQLCIVSVAGTRIDFEVSRATMESQSKYAQGSFELTAAGRLQ
jgi:hypothetical protein